MMRDNLQEIETTAHFQASALRVLGTLSKEQADVSVTHVLALVSRVRELEAALPDPDRLELLADWIDAKYPNEPEHQRDVQYDLRSWAQRIRAARGGEGKRE